MQAEDNYEDLNPDFNESYNSGFAHVGTPSTDADYKPSISNELQD